MTLMQPGGLLSSPEAASLTTPSDALALAAQLEQQRILEQKKVSWASRFNEEYTKCKNARVPFERQWYLNMAFNGGRQYVVPMTSPIAGTRLTVPRVPPHRVRLVINLVRKAVIKEASKLTMSRPIPTVVPATNENDDLTAATVSEAILKAHFATAEFETEYRMWVWWGVVCGISYMKSFYDPQGLDYKNMELPQPPMMDGQPVPQWLIDRNPELKAYLSTPQPAKGVICDEHLSPFHLFVPDLMVSDINKQPYIIEVRTKHPEWVKNRYGFMPTCDTRAQASIMESAFLTTRTSEEHLDACVVKEVWIKPNFHPDFPEGGWLVIINDKVVDYRDKWWLPFPEYPYYKYEGLPTGGFYPDSRVCDLIPVQKEYNKKRSQMIEIQNTMGKPKFFYARGSVNIRKISSEPGQGVEYIPGYNPPQQINGAEVPTSMFNEIEQLRSEFDDISGQHEISDGGTPAGVTSGTAISYLQEQDDTSLAYQVSAIEKAIELFGTHYLKYVVKWWPDNRIVRVAGKNNLYESIHFKKSGAEGNTDVKVQTGSALPFSKAAKQALITEMMQNGFISPEAGLEILDFGNFDKMMEDYLIDKRQAARENIKLADIPEGVLQTLMTPPPGSQQMPDGQIITPDGQPWRAQSPIPVNSWDNHEAHIRFHNLYRKGQEFEALSPTHKRAMELHVQTHNMALLGGQVNSSGEPMDEVAMGNQQMQRQQQFDQQQSANDQQFQQQKMANDQQFQQQKLAVEEKKIAGRQA